MKIKKTKRFTIAIASALLAFSAVSAVTGTYAWFTAANTVNVSGMNIQAETENGIVIAKETEHSQDAHWNTSVVASYDGIGKTFVPTSTKNLTTWYHGLSDQANNGQSNVSYDTFATPTITNGVANATSASHFTTEGKNIYLVNKFYVQASAKTAITGQDIFIKDVVISGVSGSENLDKSIRVGVLEKTAGFCGIYAPLSGATANYMVNGATHTGSDPWDVQAITSVSPTGSYDIIENVTIPAYTTAGTNALEFSVFVYFEGEDQNHKSANITSTLDTLALEFKFGNKLHD